MLCYAWLSFLYKEKSCLAGFARQNNEKSRSRRQLGRAGYDTLWQHLGPGGKVKCRHYHMFSCCTRNQSVKPPKKSDKNECFVHAVRGRKLRSCCHTEAQRKYASGSSGTITTRRYMVRENIEFTYHFKRKRASSQSLANFFAVLSFCHWSCT